LGKIEGKKKLFDNQLLFLGARRLGESHFIVFLVLCLLFDLWLIANLNDLQTHYPSALLVNVMPIAFTYLLGLSFVLFISDGGNESPLSPPTMSPQMRKENRAWSDKELPRICNMIFLLVHLLMINLGLIATVPSSHVGAVMIGCLILIVMTFYMLLT